VLRSAGCGDTAGGPDAGLCALVKPLLQRLAAGGRPPPEPVRRRLIRNSERGENAKVDALLSRYALLEIRINPESRVKLLRGPSKAELTAGRESPFLIRIVNEAGVTAPLRLSSPNLLPAGGPAGREQWLTARPIVFPGARRERLSGAPLEYVLLTLTTRETGLREATLAFDVGQGTQDLGFRGETSLLFRCLPGGATAVHGGSPARNRLSQ
jgi:hypothetical protein